jgi:hypothetical protein
MEAPAWGRGMEIAANDSGLTKECAIAASRPTESTAWSQYQFRPGYVINMSGYDFRNGQDD